MNGVIYAVEKSRMQRRLQTEDEDEFFQELEAARSMKLGSTWHGLHYLSSGTAGRFAGPHGFLVEGGEEFGPDTGYGAARFFSPREVDDIHGMVVDLSDRPFTRAGQGS